VHWTGKGVVLRCPVEANRIDVVYNRTTSQCVMVLKYDGNGAHLGIATADRPEGPFTLQSQTLVDHVRMSATQKAPVPRVRADMRRRGQDEAMPAGYSLFDFMVLNDQPLALGRGPKYPLHP